MKMILKNDFIDHTSGMKAYKKGDDVSHLSSDLKTFLTNGGSVESTTAPVKEEVPVESTTAPVKGVKTPKGS